MRYTKALGGTKQRTGHPHEVAHTVQGQGQRNTLISLAFVLLTTLGAVSQVAANQTLLVVGDSISAAYGMDIEQGWVALLERRLNAAPGEPNAWKVVNASISGDTTAGGRQRLPTLLERHAPDVVLIELGGNDGLRGYPITQLRDNLEAMVRAAQEADAAVFLLAMEIPPNFGSRYTQLFRDSFTTVAKHTGAESIAFILGDIATRRELMQADGIHPTAAAQPMILEAVWPALVPELQLKDDDARD